MSDYKIIEIKKSVFENNDKEAERLRKLADKLAENEDEELVEVKSTKK